MTTTLDRRQMPSTSPAPTTARIPRPPAKPRPKVRIGGFSTDLAVDVGSAAGGALALVWLLYSQLLPMSGAMGFWLSWYAAFLILMAAISSISLDRVAVTDRIIGTLLSTAGAILVACLVGIVVFTAIRGWEALQHWNFYKETTAYIGPDAPLDQGGIVAAMVGTLEQVAISVAISVPLGIATAVYLSEVRGRLAQTVKGVVEAMSAVPTIVAGLFIYSMLVLKFGQERSGFAASLALCVSMIPVVTMTAEVVLRLVPNGLREASLALGTTHGRPSAAWSSRRRVLASSPRCSSVSRA